MTVTVTVNVLPVQLPVVGVTVYMAVTGAVPAFVNVPLIEFWAVLCSIPPVNPVPLGADQV